MCNYPPSVLFRLNFLLILFVWTTELCIGKPTKCFFFKQIKSLDDINYNIFIIFYFKLWKLYYWSTIRFRSFYTTWYYYSRSIDAIHPSVWTTDCLKINYVIYYVYDTRSFRTPPIMHKKWKCSQMFLEKDEENIDCNFLFYTKSVIHCDSWWLSDFDKLYF